MPLHYFLLTVFILLAGSSRAAAQNDQALTANGSGAIFQTEPFVFEVDGNRLEGLFDRPIHVDPQATIVIVHGYGETNVVEGNWYDDLRSRFAGIGINTLIWDKPGCGNSEGEFDINQPVESSAGEVVAAVRALQSRQIAGTKQIGLWGISRAGWIAPLAIQEEPTIAFWISISGTDANENARYLLESNFPIEGRSAEETEVLVSEWQASFNTLWQGGSYEQYLQASPNLSGDAFMKLMGWDGHLAEQEFVDYQERFKRGELVVDEQEELMIYVPAFSSLLASIDKPVLALFGEKDTNVDWRKTAALYRETIGSNPSASLTVKVFPKANHILKESETGGVREMRQQAGNTPYVEGYYETMLLWLQEHHFGMKSNPVSKNKSK